MDSFMLGKVLSNRYKIEAEIGRGGMGIVYRGFDTRLNRPVAIKILSSPELSDDDRRRLLAEARAAAQLNHPNVVTVYDVPESEDQPFIVMEYVEGRTLRSVQRPTIQESIEYTFQICSALAHAHNKGIIHRDLKPENAILTPSGIVKLMDFGLARHVDEPRMTKTGTLMGTVAYMAPELVQGRAPTPQSDLYALGLMFYEFLTGNFPFRTDNIAILISQQLHDKVKPPQEIVSGLPEKLNDLVVKMVDKKPENRPSSVQAVEAVLISFRGRSSATLPTLLDQLGVQSLDELAHSRAPERAKWESDWRRNSYPKSVIPVLRPGEKKQVLSNRARELARSIQQLNEHRLLLITGMPGIGKSTLTRTLLELMPPESPPPFWYNFERQQSSGNTLGVLLDRISAYLERILGSEVREEILSFRNSPEQQASSYDVDILIDALNQPSPIWLIFDNFEAILSRGSDRFLDEGLEVLFSSLKHNTHNAKIIISGLFVPRLKNGDLLLEFGTRPLTLQGLDEKSAVECLRNHGLVDLDHATLAVIARKLDGHPFALNHAARYVEALGMQAALNDLQGGMGEFFEHFKASLQQRLSTEEFAILQDLTVLQRDISLEGLCHTAQTRPGTIKHLREEGLLETSDTGKFWLPTIVRESLKLEDSNLLRRAHLRAAEYYREQKRPATPRKIDDFADVLEWHYHAVEAGDIADAYLAVFSSGLFSQLHRWNEFTLSAELCERVHSGIQPPWNPITRTEWIQLNHVLGVTYFLLGKHGESIEHLQNAITALIESDPPSLRARLLIDLAESLGAQGEDKRAMQLCEEGVSLIDGGLEHAKGLLVRGVLHRQEGRLDQAIKDLEQARTLYETNKEFTGVAYVTGELGIVYYYLNQFSKALENYGRATQACEAMKDSRGAMIGHLNIGDVLLQERKYEPALPELRNALGIARKKKLVRDELTAGLYLSEALISLGRAQEASQEMDALQPLLVKTTSICAQGNAMRLRARLQWLENNPVEAVETLEHAIELLTNPQCDYEMARAQLDLANMLRTTGQQEQASQALAKAETIFSALNNQLGLEAVFEARQESIGN